MMYIFFFIGWLFLATVYGICFIIRFLAVLIWKFKLSILHYSEYCESMGIYYDIHELVDKNKMLHRTRNVYPPCPFTHLKWMIITSKNGNNDVTDLLED